MCKIAILERYSLFGAGIEAALAEHREFEVIGEGEWPQSLVKEVNNKNPDVILIDMLHYNNAGIRVIKKIKRLFPRVPLLIITSQNYSECFKDYRLYGARGFIFTGDSHHDLVNAVKELHAGKEYFRKGVKKVFSDVRPIVKTHKRDTKSENLLTEREISVMKLFSEGLTYKEIGMKLFISPRTVETHKENIMAKLSLQTRAEMIKYAARYGYTYS